MVKQQFMKLGRWAKRHAKVIVFGFFCLFLILTMVTFMIPGKEYSHTSLEAKLTKNIGPFVDGNSVQYEFACETKDLSGFRVLFSTYARVSVGGTIHAKLVEVESGQIVVEKAIPTEELKDNEYYLIPFEKIHDSKGKRYSIELRPENCDLGNAVTLWIGDSEEGQQTTVNGGTESGALVSGLLVEKNKYRLLWELLLLTAGSFSLWAIAPKKEREVHLVPSDDEEGDQL